MTHQKDIRTCFDALTVNAAKVMHLPFYGLEAGCDVSFVLLQARDAVEAIRLKVCARVGVFGLRRNSWQWRKASPERCEVRVRQFATPSGFQRTV